MSREPTSRLIGPVPGPGIYRIAPGQAGQKAGESSRRPVPEELLAQGSGDVPERLQRQLGQYRILRLLASGSQGDVYEAFEPALGRTVALKMLRPSLTFDTKSLQRFKREAEAGARLVHPNIVSVYAIGEVEGVHYIAQEFVGGGRTLAHLVDDVRNHAGLPADWYRHVADLFRQVAEALQAAHDRQLVHRDIKPRNILIAEDGRPKVADFGLARVLGESELTSTGDMLGTPFYMSPEQVAGNSDLIDGRSDVFSLGVVLYETLTLNRPFTGDTPLVLSKIQHTDPQDPRRVDGRVPRDLAVVCMKALEKQPDRRYATAADLAEDLRRFVAGRPIVARPPGIAARTFKWIHRHRVASVIATVVLAALVVVAYYREQGARADADRKRAEDAAALEERSGEDLLLLLENVYNGPNRLAANADPVQVPRELLDSGARRAVAIAQPGTRWALLTFIGMSYRDLNLFDEAAQCLVEAHDLALAEYGADDERVAGAALELARVRRKTGEFEAAETLLAEAYPEVERRHTPDSPRTLAVLCEMGLLDQARGRFDDAEQKLRTYVETCQRMKGVTIDESEVLIAMHALGQLLLDRGRLDEAAALLEPAYDRAASLLPKLNLLMLMGAMADLRDQQAARAEQEQRTDDALRLEAAAEGLHRNKLDGIRRVLGDDDYETGRTLSLFGVFMRRHGRNAEARPLLEEALAVLEHARGPDDVGTLYARNNLGVLERYDGNVARAEALFEEVVSSERRHPQNDSQPALTALQNLMRLTNNLGRLGDAVQYGEELVRRTSKSDPKYPQRKDELDAIQQALQASRGKP